MTDDEHGLRRFSVCLREHDRHQAVVVEEASVLGAAVVYFERFGDLADAHEASVIVRDLESGHEHCFRINLDTGETAPCA